MVTAETAAVMPVLLVVLAASVWVLACVATEMRCVDAARVGARAAARGDAAAAVMAETASLAPSGAQVVVVRSRGSVTVTVAAVVRPFGAFAHLPGTRLAARATAVTEGAP